MRKTELRYFQIFFNLKIFFIFFSLIFLYSLALSQEITTEEKFKFGGEIRIRGEYRAESDFNTLTGSNTNSIPQRIRLNLTTPLIEKTKGFIEIQDSRNWGSEVSTISNDNNLDLHQGYFEITNIFGLSLRAGRQELIYGDERLIGAFGWGNTGRSFDSVKIKLQSGTNFVDIFFSKLKETPSEYFHGIYSSCSDSAIFNTIDGYVLFKKSMTGYGMDRYTSGIRVKEKIEEIISTYEIAYQFGEEAGDKISAYAFDINAVYTFNSEIKPYLGLEYAYASGKGDKTDTFDNLYPTNHNKYGYIDYQGWRNIKNTRFTLGIKPSFDFSVDYHIFRLAEVKDAWYSASGIATLQDITGNSGDNVGSEIDFTIKFKLTKNIFLHTGYSKFFAGEFIKNTITASGGAPFDSDWLFIQTQYDF